jgi:hypothetical protein
MMMVHLYHTEFLIHVFGEKGNIITHCPEVLYLIILQEEGQELIFYSNLKIWLVGIIYIHLLKEILLLE